MDLELSSIPVKPVTFDALTAATEKIKRDIGSKVVSVELIKGQTRTIAVEVTTENLLEVGRYLHDDIALLFQYSSTMSGNDMVTYFESTMVLHSLEHGLTLRLKTKIDSKEPRCPTTVDIWPTNNWHEREIYDMFGVIFTGHPDPRRIYLSEDFSGFPLRKSFGAPGRNVGGHNGGVQILRHSDPREEGKGRG